MQRKTAIGIWNSSGWRGRRGFQTLRNNCLVEVDNFDRIQMHDHVRDLRIEFAESSSPSRLWRRTKNVVGNLLYSEIRSVRGMLLVHGEHDVFGAVNATEKAALKRILRDLKILHTENDLFECVLGRVELPNLLWFTWTSCPHSTLPSWVSLKNLKYLNVSYSLQLNTLWESDISLQRRSFLWFKDVLSSGSFSQEPLELPECLEELWANGCVKLKNIRGLTQCTRLRILSISECSELEELSGMEALECLEELWANNCVKLKRIRGLEQATKLQKLSVQGCSLLEELPCMALGCLEELWAGQCVQLKNIRGLAQCTRLRILSIFDCSELEGMEALICLEELRANNCVKLKRIRGMEQATNLHVLCVRGCSELEMVEGVEDLSLEMLGGADN